MATALTAEGAATLRMGLYDAAQWARAGEVLAAVEAAGYTGIHDLDLDDAVWDLEALSPEGQQVDLRVHGFSGEILVVEIDD